MALPSIRLTSPTIIESAGLEAVLGPDEEQKFLGSVRRNEVERVGLSHEDRQRVERLIEQCADLGFGAPWTRLSLPSLSGST